MVLRATLKFERQRSRKTKVKELGKMEKDKIVLNKVPPVFYSQNRLFGIKTFTNN